MVLISTLYYILRGPTLKEEGPLNSGGLADALSAPLSHSTTSPSDTCKETHLEAFLCIDLRWFKVSLIQGQGESVTRIADMAME